MIIVGAGPSGLVLSLLLARYGINVHLLDQSDKLDESPRAAYYQPPAIRYLDLAGVKDEARQEGFMPTGMAWRKFDGGFISGVDLTSNYDDPNHMVCLPLDLLGKLLYKHVLQEPLAKVSWSHEVTGTGQNEREAWIDVKTPKGSKRLQADYIVGCDGATSMIRRCAFGSDSPGKTWEVQTVATNVSQNQRLTVSKESVGKSSMLILLSLGVLRPPQARLLGHQHYNRQRSLQHVHTHHQRRSLARFLRGENRIHKQGAHRPPTHEIRGFLARPSQTGRLQDHEHQSLQDASALSA